ncbi:hypothetical protein [Vulcanisaeta souniana]|uniref:Uncharacterized protein n=1 Tax=Vulcanisaeta souniana JCM 11219 TaxID=1293586 RepID=A0ABN6SNZ0_9CREN|nr:hypothetical protein [Vulcanisaeta souniana]BDR91244.1 hypothetical protein Vsou_03370 [Vulcanisaeta souniana JCM 11219]
MKSKGRLILDSIINSSDNLLIITPPFINSLLASIIILIERFRRNLLTHVTLLTLESLNDLRDVAGRYNSILFVEPPSIMRLSEITNSFNGKRLFIIGKEDAEWVNADTYLEYSVSMPQLIWQLLNNELGQDSLRFLEAAIIYELMIVPNYDISSFNGWSVTEPINFPALPGILRLPLSASLSRALSPIIPGITGNETEARNLVKVITKKANATYRELGEDEVMTLLKYIGDFMLRAGFRGDYLDKLILMQRKWSDTDVDVLESILAIEAQLSLWEYINGIMSPVLNPQSVGDTDNVVAKYVSVIGEYLGQLGKANDIVLRQGYQSLTLVDRLCSIMNFYTESHNQSFAIEGSPLKIMCIFSNEEVGDAELVFKRTGYSMAVRGLRQ